jgi:hypothetical protein
MPFPQDYVRGLLFEPGVRKVANGVSSAAMTLWATFPRSNKTSRLKG